MTATLDVAQASLQVPAGGKRPSGSRRKVSLRVEFSSPEPEGADVGIELKCPRRFEAALYPIAKNAVHAGLARAGVPIPEGGFHVLIEVDVPTAGQRADQAIPFFVETFVSGAVTASLLRMNRGRARPRPSPR